MPRGFIGDGTRSGYGSGILHGSVKGLPGIAEPGRSRLILRRFPRGAARDVRSGIRIRYLHQLSEGGEFRGVGGEVPHQAQGAVRHHSPRRSDLFRQARLPGAEPQGFDAPRRRSLGPFPADPLARLRDQGQVHAAGARGLPEKPRRAGPHRHRRALSVREGSAGGARRPQPEQVLPGRGAVHAARAGEQIVRDQDRDAGQPYSGPPRTSWQHFGGRRSCSPGARAR